MPAADDEFMREHRTRSASTRWWLALSLTVAVCAGICAFILQDAVAGGIAIGAGFVAALLVYGLVTDDRFGCKIDVEEFRWWSTAEAVRNGSVYLAEIARIEVASDEQPDSELRVVLLDGSAFDVPWACTGDDAQRIALELAERAPAASVVNV